MKLFRTMLLATAAILPLSAVAHADVTFSTAQSEVTPCVPNEGFWSPTYCNNPDNSNYFAGTYQGQQSNSFFTFDLSCLKEPVCSATLELKSYCYIGNAPCLTYTLYDVCTPSCVVDSRHGTSDAIYNDLGSGTVLGCVTVKPSDCKDSTICIDLNKCGVEAINCAAGGFFTIGGSVTTPDPCGKDQGLFGFSGNDKCGQNLVCQTCCDPGGSAVPLPAGALLAPAGILAALFSAYRMRRRLVKA